MSDAEPPLNPEAVAREVCQAIEGHARVVLDEPDNIKRVIDAGNMLRDAVLRYETALRAASGWSNPIRHLGRLPMYSGDRPGASSVDADSIGSGVSVTATYYLSIEDEIALYNFVEGRGGERPSSLEAAVRFLFEADSWDVWQYPPGRVRLVRADVEVAADESP